MGVSKDGPRGHAAAARPSSPFETPAFAARRQAPQGEDGNNSELSHCYSATVAQFAQVLRGDNGSAFFFRLPLRAKSAMAEILVSDLCGARTLATAAGRLHLLPRHRAGRRRQAKKRKTRFPVDSL